MMKITETAVKNAMSLLLETNRTTTTLEVKLLLRDLGYEAHQSEVSELMSEIAEDEDISYNSNGTYKTYYREEDMDTQFGVNAGSVFDFEDDYDEDYEDYEDDEDELDDDISQAIRDFNTSMTTSDSVQNQSSKCGNGCECEDDDECEYDDEDEVEELPQNIGLYFTPEDAINSVEAQDDMTWVVYAKDDVFINRPYHTFSGDLDRDTVRVRYASMNTVGGKKMRMQNVRARRVKNMGELI